MDSVQLRDMVKSTVVIFAISTTGQGDVPQNARRFWKTLLSSALKPGLLRKVSFTSFGLGDSSYPKFNVAHRMLCGRLVQLGAQAFCPRGEGNEQHPEGHGAGLREWILLLKTKLLEAFPLPDGLEPLGDDVFLEPKWKLEPARENGDIVHTNGTAKSAYDVHSLNGESEHQASVAGVERQDDIPPPTLLPVQGAYIATLIRNDRITAPAHFQDVRLLDLRVHSHYSYNPGAVAIIYPKNFLSDVQTFIDLMDWTSIADQRLKVASSYAQDSTPSPLRHLDLHNTPLTLRYLLVNVLDIMSVPRRSFFASLSHFAGVNTEDELYQKDRLLELANPDLIDELWDYTTRPKRTILEVIMDFTTIRIPYQYALSVLPIMKGRQFSIASGGDLKSDLDGQTKVELLVAIADPPSPIIKYRKRYGVCTRYIATLKPNQDITIGLQQGYLSVSSAELKAPVVMIGPGTGVAPMRAMIYHRLAYSHHPPGSRLSDCMLIFGCRNSSTDYFFHEEWGRLERDEGLTVMTAFSREEDKARKYVQDRIREEKARLHDAIVGKKGRVYVCGSSGNMPKGVREALVEVVMHGSYTREEAEGYIIGMEKESRYKQETW